MFGLHATCRSICMDGAGKRRPAVILVRLKTQLSTLVTRRLKIVWRLSGYPNNFGSLKNTPSRVATTDTANIRWSQLGAMPTVPNPTLGERTFTAMTYDLADGLWGLTTSPYGNCSSVGKQPGECFAPQPRGMGPIHPRNKLWVGYRIAVAALAALSASNGSAGTTGSIMHSGPVFEGCTVTSNPGSGTHTLVVHFALVTGSILFTKHSDGFEVAMGDQSWHQAE